MFGTGVVRDNESESNRQVGGRDGDIFSIFYNMRVCFVSH